MRLNRIALLAIAITPAQVAMACRTQLHADQRVHVITAQENYQPKERVVVRIENGRPEPIVNDKCGGELVGLHPDLGWNATLGEVRFCLAGPEAERRPPGRVIAPGATASDTFFVSSCAYSGRWRIELALRDLEGELLPLEERVSNHFQVESDRLATDPDPRATNHPCLGTRFQPSPGSVPN
jgi:hypothetical protein